MLLPCEDNILRNVTLDRSHAAIEKLEVLPSDIARGITEILQGEIMYTRNLEK